MDIRKLILNKIKLKGKIKVADIVKATSLSRTYINRFFQELRDEGKIILIGKANQARYIIASKSALNKEKSKLLELYKTINNQNLDEDIVLSQIKKESGIFLNLSKNIEQVIDYAFLELLNNAIDHSKSEKINIHIKKDDINIYFRINDHGIGIYKNIIKKKKLKNELEAIQDLTKGKLTTAPKAHSGEGIFFVSKMGDTFIIESSSKKIIFNNILDDIFLREIKNKQGTSVTFTLNLKSKIKIDKIFKEYATDSFAFNRTKVIVKLYKIDTEYISRSQGRRVVSGLDKFKYIVLDFKDVELIGQAFADEIFRVWQNKNPKKIISFINANENINFMIKRAIT